MSKLIKRHILSQFGQIAKDRCGNLLSHIFRAGTRPALPGDRDMDCGQDDDNLGAFMHDADIFRKSVRMMRFDPAVTPYLSLNETDLEWQKRYFHRDRYFSPTTLREYPTYLD